MKKTLLVVGAVAALGLSSAFANGSMAPAPCAETFTPGIYVGLQGGYGDSGFSALEGDNSFLNVLADNTLDMDKDTGIAGRIFIGYDFHKYFAAELGYFILGPKTEANVGHHENFEIFDVRTQAFDLVGKLKGPITDNFGLYAKAGLGYLMQKYSGDTESTTDLDDNVDKFDLVYGLGMYYTFAQNWTVDASFTRYNSGHTKMDLGDWQPVVDFYAVGISYKFNLPL